MTPLTANSQAYAQIGEAASLMGQTPLYARRSLAEIGDLLLPPLLAGQLRIWKRGGTPVGLATWAWLDAATEAAVLHAGHTLAPAEWSCGDRPVVMDLVALHGDGFTIARDLSRTVFTGREVHAVRRNHDGQARRLARVVCRPAAPDARCAA